MFTQVLGVEGDKIIGLQHAVGVLVDHSEDLSLFFKEGSKISSMPFVKFFFYSIKKKPPSGFFFHQGYSLNEKSAWFPTKLNPFKWELQGFESVFKSGRQMSSFCRYA